MLDMKKAETLEQLKSAYKKAAMQNHPDRGGSDEKMKEVNALYDELFAKLKRIHMNVKGEKYEKDTKETPEEFKEIIDRLLKMSGISVDIVGTFVWVYGNTKPYKEALKKLGMRWSRHKSKWYKSPQGYVKKSKRTFSYDEICNEFGVKHMESNVREITA